MARRRLGFVLVVAVAGLAGCSATVGAPSASPDTSEQLACERTGGWWRPQLNYCEYESPTIPIR
jgi:hypothetical protein